MRSWQHSLTLMLGLLACSGAPQAQSADEDEAWIARYMASQPKPQHRAAPAATIAFSELPGLRGSMLSVVLRDGRVRQGRLERADGASLELLQTVSGGHYAFTIQRADVARIVRGEG